MWRAKLLAARMVDALSVTLVTTGRKRIRSAGFMVYEAQDRLREDRGSPGDGH